MKTATSYKKVRCPHCQKMLCKRFPMQKDKKTYWGFHIKHRGMQLWTEETRAAFQCAGCGNKVLIDSRKGIVKRA